MYGDHWDGTSINVEDHARALEIATNEAFDLKVQLDVMNREMEPLRVAAVREEDTKRRLDEALLENEEQTDEIERQQQMLEILQAELENMQGRAADTERLRDRAVQMSQKEGARLLFYFFSRLVTRSMVFGFSLWRGAVIDRASWRLGMARRASFAGCAVPSAAKAPQKSQKTVGTQTHTMKGYPMSKPQRAANNEAREPSCEVNPVETKTSEVSPESPRPSMSPRAVKYSNEMEQQYLALKQQWKESSSTLKSRHVNHDATSSPERSLSASAPPPAAKEGVIRQDVLGRQDALGRFASLDLSATDNPGAKAGDKVVSEAKAAPISPGLAPVPPNSTRRGSASTLLPVELHSQNMASIPSIKEAVRSMLSTRGRRRSVDYTK